MIEVAFEPLDLTESFYDNDVNFRIEAVIHDGEWYDFKKWLRVSKAKEEELIKWIDEHEDILIKSLDDVSYRVSYDEVIRWYKEKNIDVTTMLIPNNFPPKLWGHKTEVEVFESAPRRRVGTISFEVEDSELLDKCKDILKGVGIIIPDKLNRYKGYGLSAAYMKNTLLKELTNDEYNSLDIKTRNIIMQRELFDFPKDWLVGALQFYINYAHTALRGSQSTMDIYLPDKDDQQSQKVTWIILALKKFDETKGIPFSGYLTSVLRHWPYDLPDEHLGKELSSFQRELSKAIKYAQEEMGYEGKQVPDDIIIEIMDIEMTYYLDMLSRHGTWLKSRRASTLTWDDSANEKAGLSIGYERPVDRDIETLHDISHASLIAAIETNDWSSAYKMIDAIDHSDLDLSIMNELEEEFLKELRENISSRR